MCRIEQVVSGALRMDFLQWVAGHSEAVPQRLRILGHRFAMPQPPHFSLHSHSANGVLNSFRHRPMILAVLSADELVGIFVADEVLSLGVEGQFAV